MKHVIVTMMALVMLFICFTCVNGAVFDLKNDWSDTTNPNGAWSYNEGTNPLPHQVWNSANSPPTNNQNVYAPSDGSTTPFLPIWFKTVQSYPTDGYGNTCDWETGDIVTHSQDNYNGSGEGRSNVTFTFPNSGFANISGSVWMGRDVGRAVDWALYDNGTLLTDGSIYSGDPYDRANPFNFATGSGGASAIANIPFQAGDVIKLEFTSKVDTAGEIVGDFVGVNLSIATVPEPSTLVLLGIGAIGLLTYARRRGAA